MKKLTILMLALICFIEPLWAALGDVQEVTAVGLNVRTGPGTNYRVLSAAAKGQRYVSITTSSGWHQIWYGGKTGWMSGNYLKFVPSVSVLEVEANALPVRIGAGDQYYLVGNAQKGQRYVVIASSGTWRKIWYDGFARWAPTGTGLAREIVSSSPAPQPVPQPTPQPVPQPTPQPTVGDYNGTLSVASAKIYIPARYTPSQSIDLFIHFHGDPATVQREFNFAQKIGALVNITYAGLSAVYSQPFSNQSLFEQVILAAVAKVGQVRGVANPVRGKIFITSFSAGFGAVTQILKVAKYRDWIQGILMLDSLHSSYINGQLTSAHLVDFRAFARLAAQGKKTLILTHSSIIPPGYASTTQTAEALRVEVGSPVKIPSQLVIRGTMKMKYSCNTGNFTIYGFYGAQAVDHTYHLRYMGEFLKNL